MSKRPFAGALAMLLAIAVVAPSAFFFAPQRAHAASVGCLGGLVGGLVSNFVAAGLSVPNNSMVGNFINGETAGTTFGTCFNDLVLMPIARAAIKRAIQSMTSSVVSSINNNGAGQSSYVRDLPAQLQSVGDAVALPFIAQIKTQFNSPFGSAIAASLTQDYAQQTTLSGFFHANQCTLPGTTQSQQAFLAGDWSQGGLTTWFALTSPTQNNPYILNQAAQSQLASTINQAQTNQRQELVQSGGFLSWCGGGNTQSAGGANPTAPCFSADGTALPVLTPGSVIHDVAQKAVTSGFDQLYAQLGSANDLDSALVAIANTLINQVISTGGLFGGSAPSSSTVGGARNLTSQLQGYSDSSVAANTSGAATAQSVLDRLSGYTTAWQTIADAATAASASATQLAKVCTDAAASYAGGNGTFVSAAQAQAATAQSVITTEIAPVLAEAQTATSSTVATQAFATKVQAEAVAGSAGSSGTLSSDVATLVTMPPSVNDVAAVQQNAQVYNAAMANPTGSLTVSGGSLVDQMHLISTNAQKLETTVCNPNSSLYVQFGVNGLP